MDAIYLGYVNFNSFVCCPEKDFDKCTISHNIGNKFSSKKQYWKTIYTCAQQWNLPLMFDSKWIKN